MARADQPYRAKAERARAVKRLNEVVVERRRLRSEEQVASPKRRLKSIDKQASKP